MPEDFKTWYETMCAEFPTRFSRLFRGPMWSGVTVNQQKDPLTVSTTSKQKKINKLTNKSKDCLFYSIGSILLDYSISCPYFIPDRHV